VAEVVEERAEEVKEGLRRGEAASAAAEGGGWGSWILLRKKTP